MATSPTRVYQFGPCRLDVRERVLLRDGQAVALTPKAFDILVFLVENAGRLIEKDELMEKLWPGTFVEENNLTFNVSVLRKALGEWENGDNYIKTVPKRGYRFIAPVQLLAAAGEEEAEPLRQAGRGRGSEPVASTHSEGRRGWLQASLGALAALVAILYFATRPRPLPRVFGVIQLTTDSRVRENSRLLTDGLNLYFGASTLEGPRLAQVATTGGETVPLQPSFRALPVDISTQRHELLVGGPPLGHSQVGLYMLPLPGGSPRRVGDNLLAQDASFCREQLIAYASGQSLYLTNPNGTDRREIATIPASVGIPSGLRCSPDGKVLRFEVGDVSHRPASGFTDHSLWEVAVAGGAAHNLPTGWATGSMTPIGSWTPDGKYYVFGFPKDGRSDIWALPEKQGAFRRFHRGPVRLTNGPLSYSSPLVSGDGKRIFAIGQTMQGELVRYDSGLNEFVIFLGGLSGSWVTFSPDRQSVAYIKFPDKTLWRMKADGSERRQLTFGPMEVGGLVWSPDGAQIAIQARRQRESYGVYLIPAQGGEPQKLLPWHQDEEGIPTWSEDGSRLTFGDVPMVFGRSTGREVIHVYDLATHRLTALPNSGGLYTPRWSPDGRYVCALTIVKQQLMLFDFATAKWRQVYAGQVNNPTWSHDGKLIYFDTTGIDPALYRVRIADGKIEQIASLQGYRRAAYWWSGLAPDDSPIILRDIGTSEIYALDVDWP